MRSLFRWGSPGVYKHPNPRLVKLMMDKFQLGPRDLQEPENAGLETFSQEIATGLSTQQQDALTSLLGPEQVSLATYDRIKAGYGKTMLDLFRIRSGKLENIPDAVVFPRDRKEIADVLRFARDQGIALQTRGAGSSVTRGCEAPRGGITLDLSKHMHRILKINSINE